MKKYEIGKLRNVAFISHGGAGKTSLTEAVLFDCGLTNRLGKVADGTTVTDYDSTEIRKKISINTTIAPCEWRDHKINILDTPGYADFVGDVLCALRVVEGAVILVCAVSGVEVGTENVWRYAEENKLPRVVFINKMDRENAAFSRNLELLRKVFGKRIIPFQIPIGEESAFKGIIDLINRKAIIYPNNSGKEFKEEAIPKDLEVEANKFREMLVEAAAETSDELTTKYLESGDLLPEEIKVGLKAGILSGQIVPVVCGAALKNIGMQPLLDLIVDYFPSPLEIGEVKGINPKTESTETRKISEQETFSALVFKTLADPYVGKLSYFRVYSGVLKSDSYVHNSVKGKDERIGQVLMLRGKSQEPLPELRAGDIGAVAKLSETSTGETLCDKEHPIILLPIKFPSPIFSQAFEPKTKGDEDKLSTLLTRIADEDRTLTVRRDTEIGQTIVSGMGETHLEIVVDRLKNKFGVDVNVVTPRISYKETIRAKVQAEYKHKKQTGGHGQYGHVFLELEPLSRGANYEFVDKIYGGAIPRQFIPGVEKGVKEAMLEGVLAGYPVVDIKVTLFDGSYHVVDSNEISFKIAGLMAFKRGMQEAKPVLLEPIMNMEVTVPEENMGDVIGDLNSRRGKILGVDAQGRNQVIKALVPLAEVQRYAIDLKSLTQGRGIFTMSFSHYEEVPNHIAEKIIAEAKRAKEQAKS